MAGLACFTGLPTCGFNLPIASGSRFNKNRPFRLLGPYCYQEGQPQLLDDISSNHLSRLEDSFAKGRSRQTDLVSGTRRDSHELNSHSKPEWSSHPSITSSSPDTEVGGERPGSSAPHPRRYDEIQKLCDNGQLDDAVSILLLINQQATSSSVTLYRSVLNACAKRKALDQAKRLYAHLEEHGIESTRLLGEDIVITLVKCGGLEDAVALFDRLPYKSATSWTALISGYAACGRSREALGVYCRMQENGVVPDTYTFVSLLKACATLGDLEEGKRIHNDALRYGCETDLYVRNSLVDMYGKCGSIAQAKDVFFSLPLRDVVTWNAMLAAFAQQGQADKALQMYTQMREDGVDPNNRTFVSALQACGMLGERAEDIPDQDFDIMFLQKGRAIHADAWRLGYASDVFVGSTILTMYGKLGSIADAWIAFDELLEPNLVSWNSMLTVYGEWGQAEKVLQLYEEMLEEGISPDSRTFVSVFQACGTQAEKEDEVGIAGRLIKLSCLARGKALHTSAWVKGLHSHVFVGSALITMYVKCGSVEDARDVFDRLSCRDVVAWNAMLSAHTQHNEAVKALQLYEDMLNEGLSPDVWTYVHSLQACAAIVEEVEHVSVSDGGTKDTCLVKGKLIHEAIYKKGYYLDWFVASTLVNMYAKCGSIADAWNVFNMLSEQNVVMWTAMIAAYVEHGQVEKALELYVQMWEEGVSPNDRTILSALKACSTLSEREEYVSDGTNSIKARCLSLGRGVHADARMLGYDSGVMVGTALISMYHRCGSTEDAWQVFTSQPHHDVSSWAVMLAAYVEHGHAEKALLLYDQMQQEGTGGGVRIFVLTLQACGMLAEKAEKADVNVVDGKYTKQKCLEKVRAVHVDAQRNGCASNIFVGSTLVSTYGKCGSIMDASHVFESLTQRDVVTWNAMLVAYAQQGEAEKVMELYEVMLEEGVRADTRIYVTVVQACGTVGEKELGIECGEYCSPNMLKMVKAIHLNAWQNGYNSDLYISHALLTAYGKCGSIDDTTTMFQLLPERNLSSWNALVTAHVEQEQADRALQIYSEVCSEGTSPDAWTYVKTLQACCILAEKEEDVGGTKVQSFVKGKIIHAHVRLKDLESHSFIGNTLVTMYGKCGSTMDARIVFDGLVEQEVVSWNAMLGAYTEQGQADEALRLYEKMLEEGVPPDGWTFSAVLQACGLKAQKGEHVAPADKSIRIKALAATRFIHAEAWDKGYDSDVFVQSTLVSIYGKCKAVDDAFILFGRLPLNDAVSWNAMLAAYIEGEHADKALSLYRRMHVTGVSPDAWSFVSALQACGMLAEKEQDGTLSGQPAKVKALRKAKAVHADARRRGHDLDIFVGNTLVSVYGKCRMVTEAQHVFDSLPQRNVMSWTAILAAYLEEGHAEKALQLYRRMQVEGPTPKESTLVSILQLCSKTGGLVILREIHEFLVSTQRQLSSLVASSLISAFGRCASMESARSVFDALVKPDVLSWNALLAGYARKGDHIASLRCYQNMQVRGVKPDGVTFLSLLCACSHAGLVDKGVEYFESMSRDYSVTPEVEHYVSMVDLLGRAGYFSKVEDLLSRMPMQASIELWFCLLAACQKHGKIVLAEKVFKFALSLEPKHSAPYVLMSNIYADAGLLDHAKKVQQMRQKVGAWKKPGKSWIEHKQVVHTFMAGDRNHPQKQQIYSFLKHDSMKLRNLMKLLSSGSAVSNAPNAGAENAGH